MSVRLMAEVWETDLPPGEKLVLLALADNADDDGRCWPSIATIAAKSSKCERSVQAAIKALVSMGCLTRTEVMGKGCKYIVHPRKICTPAKYAPPQKLRDTPAKSAPKPSMNHQYLETDVSKLERPREPKPAKAEKPDPFPKLDCVSVQVWADFLVNRKKKKLSNTATAHDRLTRDLAAMAAHTGWPPGEVMIACVARGWGGIYDPRNKNERSKTNRAGGQFPATRDNRDGFQRALDRMGGLGPESPAEPVGRSDFGGGAEVIDGKFTAIAAMR